MPAKKDRDRKRPLSPTASHATIVQGNASKARSQAKKKGASNSVVGEIDPQASLLDSALAAANEGAEDVVDVSSLQDAKTVMPKCACCRAKPSDEVPWAAYHVVKTRGQTAGEQKRKPVEDLFYISTTLRLQFGYDNFFLFSPGLWPKLLLT